MSSSSALHPRIDVVNYGFPDKSRTEIDEYIVRAMTLVIAARNSTELVVGSEMLQILVDTEHPEKELGRKYDEQKIYKYRQDFAVLIAGTFEGKQMYDFLKAIEDLIRNVPVVEISSVSDIASGIAKNIFRLKPHHNVGFIFAGFNGQTPSIEVIGSEKDFEIGALKPEEMFYAGGRVDFAIPYLGANLNNSMTTKEIKEVVRRTINLAKKSDPELGGRTDVKVLRRPY